MAATYRRGRGRAGGGLRVFLLVLRLRTHVEQPTAVRPTSNYVSPRKLSRADRLLIEEYVALVARAQAGLQAKLTTYLVG